MTDDEPTLDDRVIAMAIFVVIVRIRQSEDTPEERLAAAEHWADTLLELVNDETWHHSE